MHEHLADRQRMTTLRMLEDDRPFDAIVIGGGATGLGIAVDGAKRGLRVALLERGDFGEGTSSRSTKLVHGGVRYLAQGDFKLVYEALHERANLLANAPHIARPLSFVMPAYRYWHLPFYGAGLMAYDLLAGQAGIGSTRWLAAAGVQRLLPTVRAEGLLGGVSYWDGQFDDARLAIALARTAEHSGAVIARHVEAKALIGEGHRIAGVAAVDVETNKRFVVRGSCVINATGVWTDGLLADSGQAAQRRLVVPSQGVHLAFDRSFLPTTSALFWPKTSDGRVLFAIPWLGKTIIGTTDSRCEAIPRDPQPLPGEVDYLLRECANFFAVPPRREDILSAWAGLRPLVNPKVAAEGGETKSISREHTVLLRPDGLVTVTGGKWTTYRSMAQDVLDQCCDAGLLDRRGPCVTATTPLVGAAGADPVSITETPSLQSYGNEAALVASLPGAQREVAPGLTEAMVRFAVRNEYARTVGDVLARRSRLLFLDARAALAATDAVADIVESETSAATGRESFRALAATYLRPVH